MPLCRFERAFVLRMVMIENLDFHAAVSDVARKRSSNAHPVIATRAEAELAQLTRDYDSNKTQYTSLLNSYQKARLGEQADNAGSVPDRKGGIDER